MKPRSSITRVRAAGLHLLLSGLVAALSAALVFLVWFPAPFNTLAGGAGLFLLLVSVDVVLGPALTAVVASPGKSLVELTRDLAVIVVVQLAAFGYGLYTMALARPVLLVFEVDRLRVVTAADIDRAWLVEASPGLERMSWTGPRLIAAVKPGNPADQMKSIELGLAGVDLAMQPKQWRDYAPHADDVWRVARPASVLLAQYPQWASDAAAIARSADQPPEALRFLPLVSRQASWAALIASPGARIVGHLPVDGFF
jgi:hypothetical protein